MAANFYPTAVYTRLDSLDSLIKAFLGISLVTAILGCYSGKIVATQMIGVIQISAVGLTLIHYASPLLYPFRILKYAHGYNPSTTLYQSELPT